MRQESPAMNGPTCWLVLLAFASTFEFAYGETALHRLAAS